MSHNTLSIDLALLFIVKFLITMEILNTQNNFNIPKIGRIALVGASLSNGIVESKSIKNLPNIYLLAINLGSNIS